jgi:malate synthase
VQGAAELFTPEFNEYLLFLHDRFMPKVHALRQKRAQVLLRALQGTPLAPLPPSEATTTSWQVPPVPEELRKPGIEISGPVSITSMFINALNPGPDGTRAEGDLDDDEDSAGHRLIDTLAAARNRLGAVERTLSYVDTERGRTYAIQPGEIPFFMHRERGLLLDEAEVTVDGKPIPASILGTALTLFHAGRAHAARGQGIYFYLPKLESAEEAAFWREFFDASRERLPHLRGATIRAIALIESLPAVYQMEEMLHALGPYAAGLNAARWDLKASVLEYVMGDPNAVWPDRFGVDIKTTPFMSQIFQRLVAVCLKHDAVAIGGMATALPSRDEAVNQAAATSIRADKEWEAKHGFLRGWVAHIFHMKTAADPFKELRGSGWTPSADMANPDNYPVQLQVPAGPVTVEGTRRNARVLLEYLEGWLRGRGAKGIDSLAGKPGLHPALMEDLATARISVAQIAQRVRYAAKDDQTGQAHDFPLVKQLLNEELQSILSMLPPGGEGEGGRAATEDRYRRSLKIAQRWIKNYTELDFRPLGSYTHADLNRIAGEADAF